MSLTHTKQIDSTSSLTDCVIANTRELVPRYYVSVRRCRCCASVCVCDVGAGVHVTYLTLGTHEKKLDKERRITAPDTGIEKAK